jgi:hypothetical protein
MVRKLNYMNCAIAAPPGPLFPSAVKEKPWILFNQIRKFFKAGKSGKFGFIQIRIRKFKRGCCEGDQVLGVNLRRDFHQHDADRYCDRYPNDHGL